MIRYGLKCENGHDFEAWFSSSSAFEDQVKRSLVTCAICGSADVTKALMAPGIAKKGGAEPEREAPAPALSGPVPKEIAEKLTALRKEIEKNSSYVGKRFASEARAMHLGESEARAIHGEATGEEAKSLIEEGVPVMPLPFLPGRDD